MQKLHFVVFTFINLPFFVLSGDQFRLLSEFASLELQLLLLKEMLFILYWSLNLFWGVGGGVVDNRIVKLNEIIHGNLLQRRLADS